MLADRLAQATFLLLEMRVLSLDLSIISLCVVRGLRLMLDRIRCRVVLSFAKMHCDEWQLSPMCS